MKLKKKKGEYGYLNAMRSETLLRALLLTAFASAVFLTGKFLYPDYSTMFGITAVVICIPAAMSVVSFVMFMLHKTGRKEIHEECERLRGNVPVFYDSVITTREKSYGVNVFACAGGNLIGYSEYEKFDASVVEKHLREMSRKNELSGVGVKLFTEFPKFQNRLSKLSEGYEKAEPEDLMVLQLVGNLSL